MEYVDGGALKGWQKAAIVGAIAVVGIAVLTAAAFTGGAASYTLAAGIAATIPVGGWVTGGAIVVYAGSFAAVAANAIHEGKGMRIRLGLPTILNFSVE